MTVKTNSLRVRRIDLLEQLEERYAYMTKEKERYEKEHALYEKACDKYWADIKRWEASIEPFMLEQFSKAKPELTHYNREWRYSRPETWRISVDVSYTMDDLIEAIGNYPEKPDCPSMPAFLHNRDGYSRKFPSVYQAVYQAVTLLSMSDDEYVNAATYQMALEVL